MRSMSTGFMVRPSGELRANQECRLCKTAASGRGGQSVQGSNQGLKSVARFGIKPVQMMCIQSESNDFFQGWRTKINMPSPEYKLCMIFVRWDLHLYVDRVADYLCCGYPAYKVATSGQQVLGPKTAKDVTRSI